VRALSPQQFRPQQIRAKKVFLASVQEFFCAVSCLAAILRVMHTSAVGTMEIKLSRGTLRIAGAVDVVALRTAIDCFAGMIGLPTGTRIWIAAGVTDLRRGFTGLSGMAQTALRENPFSGFVSALENCGGDGFGEDSATEGADFD
jgi:hypothetical protein